MVQISKCCDSQATGDLLEGAENTTFGKCAECGDYTFFDEVTESHAELLEESNTSPYTFTERETSYDRLQTIGPKCKFPVDVVRDFNPAIISWVAERLGITAEDGVAQALADGHFVINTAKEINNDAQIKMQVEPGSGTVLNTLNAISEVVTNVLTTTNQKVVFHCAMGMERSVLACIWFMASQWRMRIDQSYQQIKKHRPIALDRTDWITL
jgi:hypothetical protein